MTVRKQFSNLIEHASTHSCPCGRGVQFLVERLEKAEEETEKLRQAEKAADKEVQRLLSSIQFLVDFMDKQGQLEDHCFTFPDGETVYVTGYQIIEFLEEILGSILVKDIRSSSYSYSSDETRLRKTFNIIQLLQEYEGSQTIRAWFIGTNPQLKESTPIQAIKEGLFANVMAAAKSFVAEG